MFKNFILKTIKNYWQIILLLGACMLLLRSFFQPGFPQTHDGQNHLARLADLHLAFVDRHFPFRWAPNLNYKFGYPVFNFNYYLPQAIGLLPLKMGFSMESSLKIVGFLSFFMGGVFWYLFLSQTFSKVAGFVGALFYITAPYQLVTIFVRGSFGEIVAFGIMPYLIWSLYNFIRKPSPLYFVMSTLGIIAFVLAHNIMLMLGLPFLLFFTLLTFWQEKLQKEFLRIFTPFLLGLGMSLFFIIPALTEKKYTNLDLVGLSHNYLDHFPTFGQLIFSPWGYGFSVAGTHDGLSFQIGPVHLLVLVLVFLSIFRLIGSKKEANLQSKNYFWFFLCLGVLAVVMMNKISLPIWHFVSFLRYVQFPWRLLIFTALSTSFLAAWFSYGFPKLGVVLAAAAFVYAFLLSKPGGWFHWNNDYYYEFPFSTSVLHENMPRWFDQVKNIEMKGKIIALTGDPRIRELKWRTQEHLYEIESDSETEIIERTAYFPGWEVWIDDHLATVNYQHEDYPGVISFKIPAGIHRVKTVFTENTPARDIGDKLSVLSLVIFLWLVSKKIFLEKKLT